MTPPSTITHVNGSTSTSNNPFRDGAIKSGKHLYQRTDMLHHSVKNISNVFNIPTTSQLQSPSKSIFVFLLLNYLCLNYFYALF